MEKAEQLIAEIEAAFDGVRLGGGATLHEAVAFEGTDYATPEKRQRVRALDPQTRWQDIPDSSLEQCEHFFAVDEEGFRFHLPAYMRWLLRHPRGLPRYAGGGLLNQLWLSGHKPKDRLRAEQDFDKFTPVQKRLIARFLEFMALESADPYITDLARQVWESYWFKFAEPSPGQS